jgi:hypothetical protein
MIASEVSFGQFPDKNASRGVEVPDWADVYEPDLDVRLDLQPNALFFIPRARADLNGETVASLATYSGTLKRANNVGLAGRNAIKKVWNCEPVVYASALGFVALANYLKGTTIFSTTDIAACIFKIPTLRAAASAKNLSTATDITAASGVPERIVLSALDGYRVSFNHAQALFKACADPAIKLENFVVTKARNDSRTSVKQDTNGYVYRRADLTLAPQTGHHWAIR